MIYVVLGMHKSGTTLLSQILHYSGINMGEFDADVSYDKGNKYERQSTLDLDLDILGTEDYEVLDLSPHEINGLSETQRDQMKTIITGCNAAHEAWGFKDPRACLTYDLWAEELPEHKLIIVFRDPAQVWPRFKWMGKRKYHTNFSRAYSYLHRWQEHNRNILRFMETSKRERLVLSYNELMTEDAEFRRLEEFVGMKLEDRRRPDLFRSKSKKDIFLKFGDWLLGRRSGITTKDTMEALHAARARQLG